MLAATASGNSMEIGDTIVLTVPFEQPVEPESVRISAPEQQSLALLIGDPSAAESSPGSVVVPVTVLTSDMEMIGPLEVRVAGDDTEYLVGEIPVSVSEPVVEESQAKDYTAFMQAPFNWPRALAIGSLVSVAAALLLVPLIVLFRRLGRKGPAVQGSVPAVPPLDELGRELSELKTLADYHARGSEAHYTRLSHALRRYFERVHGIPAVEMSDEEMITWIRRRHGEGGSVALLIDVFDDAGFAKFARVALPEDTVQAKMERATAFHHAEESARAAAPGREGTGSLT